ncbi:MAG TPA: dihydroorotate dehydrogenase-like protein [Pirellulales bacterium]|nr:dihydroorotate dehydrogenase-like protein [Pirellulales bacterium]
MSVDLSTHYLGLKLRNPLVIAASPLCAHLHSLERLQEAGAAAAVMASLFEEQIVGGGLPPSAPQPDFNASASNLLRFSELYNYNAGPDSYLRHVELAKRSLSIPVIGSLNGTAAGGWVRFARLIQEAGADALELNIYFVPTHSDQTAADVERQYIDLVVAVRAQVTIPLAVKIGPYFTSIPNMARRLVEAGANGLTLFNRYLQPDINLDTLEVGPNLVLSGRNELSVPLRWIAVLRGQLDVSLAATSGIHFAEDLIKLVLAGADVGMLASALIRNGPAHLRTVLAEFEWWLDQKHYTSVEQIKGSLSQKRCANPSAYERANYIKTVTSGNWAAR